jgi:hypothetical protein
MIARAFGQGFFCEKRTFGEHFLCPEKATEPSHVSDMQRGQATHCRPLDVHSGKEPPVSRKALGQ